MSETQPSWLDRAFFVKNKKFRLVVALVSCAIAVATSLYLRYTKAFATHGYVIDVLARFLICIPLGLVLMFTAMGVYNLLLHFGAKNGSKDDSA